MMRIIFSERQVNTTTRIFLFSEQPINH